MTARSVLELIGNTPLIRLRRASEATGCEILGKAEFLNPGQSVKDRAALYIIRDAERRGLLKPGGRIVEGTAGNTGIGLAMVARRSATGPRSSSRAPRARRRRTPSAWWGPTWWRWTPSPTPTRTTTCGTPAGWRRSWRHRAGRGDLGQPVRQRRQPPGARRHTGPEIWEQTEGAVDGFICAVGTGGTLAGVADALRERARSGHRPRRPLRRGALRVVRPRRAEVGRHLDHRRHRPGPHHRQPRGAEGRLPLPGRATRR